MSRGDMFLPAQTTDPGIGLGDASMSVARPDLANAVRALSTDAVEKANSGHPGAPMGMADIAEVLWNDFLASTGAVRKFLAENPKDFDPRKFLTAATKAMKEICMARFEAFGCSGKASRIQPLRLELMFQRYQSGERDPRLH